MGSLVLSHWWGVILNWETINPVRVSERYCRSWVGEGTNSRNIPLNYNKTTFICTSKHRGTLRNIWSRGSWLTKFVYVVKITRWCTISIYLAGCIMDRQWWCMYDDI